MTVDPSKISDPSDIKVCLNSKQFRKSCPGYLTLINTYDFQVGVQNIRLLLLYFYPLYPRNFSLFDIFLWKAIKQAMVERYSFHTPSSYMDQAVEETISSVYQQNLYKIREASQGHAYCAGRTSTGSWKPKMCYDVLRELRKRSDFNYSIKFNIGPSIKYLTLQGERGKGRCHSFWHKA